MAGLRMVAETSSKWREWREGHELRREETPVGIQQEKKGKLVRHPLKRRLRRFRQETRPVAPEVLEDEAEKQSPNLGVQQNQRRSRQR